MGKVGGRESVPFSALWLNIVPQAFVGAVHSSLVRPGMLSLSCIRTPCLCGSSMHFILHSLSLFVYPCD